jgi:hypothetical protein
MMALETIVAEEDGEENFQIRVVQDHYSLFCIVTYNDSATESSN